MLGHLPAWRAVIQKLPGRCYLALRHHSLSPRHPPELAGGFQTGTGTFNLFGSDSPQLAAKSSKKRQREYPAACCGDFYWSDPVPSLRGWP